MWMNAEGHEGSQENMSTDLACGSLADTGLKVIPGHMQEVRLDVNSDEACDYMLPKFYKNKLMVCAGNPVGSNSICSVRQ